MHADFEDRSESRVCNAADLDVGFSGGSPIQEFDAPAVIVGAGNIGRMIAERFLFVGRRVHLIDRNQAQLDGARAALERSFDTEIRDHNRKDELFARCKFLHGDLATDVSIQEILKGACLVIEALPESLTIKESVLGELDSIVPKNIPIATVSSSFPVSQLLAKTTHAERFLNAHPLQRGIDAIEMMPGLATAPGVMTQVSSLFSSIGMVPIQVQRENVGFIFNILWKGIKEIALHLVETGVAKPEDIDRLWMMAFKTKIGLFGIMDLVGLDVVRDIELRYSKIPGGNHKAVPAFLERLVSEGRLGVKTGKGFYTYPAPAYARPGFLERGLELVEEVSPTRDTLIGTWKLVSFTAKVAGDDKVLYPMGAEAQGKLIYGADGSMAVHLTRPNRNLFASPDPLAATNEERSGSFSEFFTYLGKFRYSQGIVFHDVEFCSFPNWQGATVVRGVSLDPDGTLTLSTPPFQLDGTVSVQELRWRRA